MFEHMRKATLAVLCIGLLTVPVLGCAGNQTASEEIAQTDTSVQAEDSASAEAPASTETPELTIGDSSNGTKKKDASDQKSSGKPEGGERSDSSDGTSSGKGKHSGDSSTGDGRKKGSDNSSQSGKKSDSSHGSKKSGSSSTATGTAAKALTDGEALNGGTYTAAGDDESALSASGTVKASVTGAEIIKSAGNASSADGASFTGVNAAVRVYDSAELTMTDCTVEASASNATGVFAYDKGVVTLENCTVTVSGGGAGGVQVAGGGTLYGTNLTVTSASKAAIRSDRGGGIMVLDGGTYTSTGSNGCPAIYSTADITVKNADCISTNSRAVIIEGKNSVTLENCTLTGNDQSTKEGSVKANVLLYQSASGDASVGTSVFTMTGGSMKSNSGAMFYCTNTASVINLESAELILSEDGTLLTVSAGRWGKDGKNGGDCTLNAKDQTLSGSILADAISSLTLNLSNSHYTGAVTGEGKIAVTMDAGSTWTLTGDSYATSVDGDLSGLNLNGYTLYVNGVAYTG